MAFYLDKVDATSGALRVIPGSHRMEDRFSQELRDKASKSREYFDIHGADIPAQVLDIIPGDVLLFNHNLMHSSWGGSNRRRMFTMNVCERYPNQALDELKEIIRTHSGYIGDRNYGPLMMETAGANRMKHLQQIMDNDGHLADVRKSMNGVPRGWANKMKS